MMRRHDKSISIAKGIGIILMVVSHSGDPDVLNRFIYAFLMPMFLFMSGYLFDIKYLDNKKLFLKKRLKSLYLPFVKWSLIFLLFHNLLAGCGIYDEYYTWRTLVMKAAGAVAFRDTDELLKTFWFLRDLFWASMISLCFLWICCHVIKNHPGWDSARSRIAELSTTGVMIIACLAVASLGRCFPINIPLMGSHTAMSVACFLAGFLFRKVMIFRNMWLGMFMLSVVLFYVWISGKGYEMLAIDNLGVEVFMYFMISMIGAIGMMNLCSGIKGRVADCLDYIGTKTLYVMTWHLVAFKLVSMVKIWHYGYDWQLLSSFPVIMHDNAFFWVLYSAVGIALPITGCIIYDGIKLKLRKQEIQ